MFATRAFVRQARTFTCLDEVLEFNDIEPMAESKRQRVDRIAGIGGVSNNALLRIFERIREEPSLLEEVRTRRDIDDRSGDYEGLCATLALPMHEGGPFLWKIASPQRLVQYCVRSTFGISEAWRAQLQRNPSTQRQPWRMIIFTDEVVPGSVLAPDPQRKVYAWYFSFMEFGAPMLRKTASWFTIGTLRSAIVKNVEGGLSCVGKLLLHSIFLGDESFSDVGVPLQVPSGEPLLFFFFKIRQVHRGRTCAQRLVGIERPSW